MYNAFCLRILHPSYTTHVHNGLRSRGLFAHPAASRVCARFAGACFLSPPDQSLCITAPAMASSWLRLRAVHQGTLAVSLAATARYAGSGPRMTHTEYAHPTASPSRMLIRDPAALEAKLRALEAHCSAGATTAMTTGQHQRLLVVADFRPHTDDGRIDGVPRHHWGERANAGVLPREDALHAARLSGQGLVRSPGTGGRTCTRG